MAWWNAVPILGTILDKFMPDRTKASEAQARINESEVSGAPPSILRLWRSFLGWVLSLLFVWEIVGRGIIMTYWPNTVLPPSTMEPISRLLLGMLGFGY